MSKRKKETSNISHPWNSKKRTATGIQCPKCGNDGMDGTITAIAAQYNLTRVCNKLGEDGKACNQRWSGGIGVQKADFSQPMPVEGVADPLDDRPLIQHTGPAFRDPSKNRDIGEE